MVVQMEPEVEMEVYDVAHIYELLIDGGYDKNMEAYQLLNECVDTSVLDRMEWLSMAAEAAYGISNFATDERDAYRWLLKAREHALEAHGLNETHLDTLRLLCATTGRLAEESSILDKIRYGFEFKSFLDKAVESYPNTYEFLHMRGRFRYRICMMNVVERTAARAFGVVPDVTLNDALADLLAAQAVDADIPENMIYIAKAYKAANDRENAKLWFEKTAYIVDDSLHSLQRQFIDEAREVLLGNDI